MENTELQVIVKAKDLAEHTIRVTSNCKTFPKKYRFTLVDKMQVKSLNIYENLMEANILRVGDEERKALQTKVITLCDELQFFIELTVRLEIIGVNRAEYWIGLILAIKSMTIAWRRRDKERSEQVARC